MGPIDLRDGADGDTRQQKEENIYQELHILAHEIISWLYILTPLTHYCNDRIHLTVFTSSPREPSFASEAPVETHSFKVAG
jgi:hypothetical protein